MGVSMIGAVVAYVATIYLTPIAAPLMDMVGIRNPVTVWWLTPIVVYLLIFLMMNGAAQGIYMKVNLFFQYRAKEDAKIRFERMDVNVGLALGIANGCVLLTILSVPIYVAGYVSVQFKGQESDPILYSMLNRARTDLTSTGFDKVSAALAPNTDELFQLADTAALIYHNPGVQDFLGEYPEFYHFVEENTIGGDTDNSDGGSSYDDEESDDFVADFTSLLTGQGGLGAILAHPRTLELMSDSDFMGVIENIDYADLTEFINTGISPKYQDDPIVGKWRIDLPRSVRDYGRKLPQLRPAYLSRLPAFAKGRFGDIHLIISPTGSAYLKGKAGAFTAFGTLYGMIQQRMPLRGLPRNAASQTLAVGSWSAKSDDTFTVSLDGKVGKSAGDAKLKGGFLSFIQSANTCVFYKFR
jgi:hypothetical protein